MTPERYAAIVIHVNRLLAVPDFGGTPAVVYMAKELLEELAPRFREESE